MYRYEILNLLGKGTFGQVCQCYDHKEKEFVSIKIVKNTKNSAVQAQTEIKILKLIAETASSDYHIVQYKNSFCFRSHVCIVTELLGKNLYEVQKSYNFCSFSQSLLKNYTRQILSGLSLLSALKVIHCDLKLENILVSSNDKEIITIIDFGSSCLINEKIYSYIQSRFYRAPEIILGISYTASIDMWSLGCILAELELGQPLFPANCEVELLQMMMQVKGLVPAEMLAQAIKKAKFFNQGEMLPSKSGKILKPMTKSLSDYFKGKEVFGDFIERCLEWDPSKRLKPDEALLHPWLESEKSSKKLFLRYNNRKFLMKKLNNKV